MNINLSHISFSIHKGIEDLAQRVSAKLRLEEEKQIQSQQQHHDDETNARVKEEEQKKRWAALRGSPSKQQDVATSLIGRGRGRGVTALNNLRRPGEKVTPSTAGANNNANLIVSPENGLVTRSPPGITNTIPNIMGRGMGRGTMLHSNRLQINTTTGDYTDNNEDEIKWAASIQAPSASEAPRPPRAWMS